MQASPAVLVCAVAFLATACDAAAPLRPTTHLDDLGPRAAAAGAPARLDVGGSWQWRSVEHVAFPAFLAGLLGVQPEGDLTHGLCESVGTLTLVQTGATFRGTALRELNACTTRGGQPFTQPGVVLSVVNGRVTGKAVHFELATPMVAPCPHHVTVTSHDGGMATRLQGHGLCRLPGHPQSESLLQADPPQEGYSRTPLWEAVR